MLKLIILNIIAAVDCVIIWGGIAYVKFFIQ